MENRGFTSVSSTTKKIASANCPPPHPPIPPVPPYTPLTVVVGTVDEDKANKVTSLPAWLHPHALRS